MNLIMSGAIAIAIYATRSGRFAPSISAICMLIENE